VGEDESSATTADGETRPYDPAWIELAEPPLERLRREAIDPPSGEPSRYPPAAKPTVAP
jgi:hypothetical protein